MTEFLGDGGQSSELILIEPQSIVPENAAHPVRILMEEHTILVRQVERAKSIAESLKGKCIDGEEVGAEITEIGRIADFLLKSDNHYQREENVLFPYLEKHGITGPPAAMWIEHKTIRETKKQYQSLIEDFNALALSDFVEKLAEVSDYLQTILSTHYYKENNVLFQMALKTFTEEEWVAAREEFDEIGYCCYIPEPPAARVEAREVLPAAGIPQNAINFESGYLFPSEVEAILNTIPLEITFIDSNDQVRYFNRSEERLFIRTKASLGRKVHQCHPQKSIHLVKEIVDDFKSGKRDVADFWIEFQDRFVHIRFFPVRDREGNYLGSMEVVQDITDIKKLEGEKRLL